MRKTLLLILSCSLLLMPALAHDSRPATFISADGFLTFEFPQAWRVNNVSLGRSINIEPKAFQIPGLPDFPDTSISIFPLTEDIADQLGVAPDADPLQALQSIVDNRLSA